MIAPTADDVVASTDGTQTRSVKEEYKPTTVSLDPNDVELEQGLSGITT